MRNNTTLNISLVARGAAACRRALSLTVVAVLCACTAATAQNAFNLPYSQFGLGETGSPYDAPLAGAIGGTLFATRSSNMVNPYNPASYSAVESESFVFVVGLTLQQFKMKDPASSLSDFDGSLSHLTMAMPITRWWKTSLGLTPYSETAYESTMQTTGNAEGTVKTIYDGSGEIFRIYWGNAFNIGRHWSVGANINYLYGDILHSVSYDLSASSNFVSSRKLTAINLSALTFDIGTQYTVSLTERRQLTVGLSLQLPRTMKSSDSAWIYTMSSASSETSTAYSLVDNMSYRSDVELPASVGFGVSYEYDSRWRLSADVAYAPWHGMKYTSAATNPVMNTDATAYDKNCSFALSAAWLGNREAASYWQRIGLRAGLHYEVGHAHLNLNDGAHSLNQFGAGFGLIFPMRKGRSRLEISLGYSSLGSADLLRVNCTTIGLSLSSCEQWFTKRKYN